MTSSLILDLLSLEPGEALQAHVEDRLGLPLRHLELCHEPFARDVDCVGTADQGDNRVDVVERDP